MKRDRVAVWLDAVDEDVRWLKYEVEPKKRGEVIREALKLYRGFESSKGSKGDRGDRGSKTSTASTTSTTSTTSNNELKTLISHLKKENEVLKQEITELKKLIDDNVVIVGQSVLSQLELAFSDREVDDALIQTILIRGIRSLKKEEEEREKTELLKSLQEV